MACILASCPTFDADYQGPIGASFSVAASGTSPATDIAAASYGTTTLTSAPFTFTIVAGVATLATIIEGGAIGDVIQLEESCPGGGNQILRQFVFTDPLHTTSSLRIKGV